MDGRLGGRRLHPATKAATALVAGVALFLATAAMPVRGHAVVIALIGAIYVYAIVSAALRMGPTVAVSLAVAAGLAFDSFLIPPTREFDADNWENWIVVAIYLSLGLLAGMLAERAQRRAEASEASRARLAEEQMALRRVATLVARGAPKAEVFASIAEALGYLMAVDHVRMWRFEADGTAATVASAGELGDAMPLGARERIPPDSLAGQVRRSGRSARVDDYAGVVGRVGRRAREIGVGSAVATPIVVDGRLWGAMVAASRKPARFPADTEARMHQFTELLATAIANLDARAERDASRARIIEATDLERRRVVRDLHDGAQQRLVHTVVTLKLAQRALDGNDEDARSLVTEALAQANQANTELRELAHGILPAVVTRGGLRAGVDALVSRIHLPVHVDVAADRYPPGIEASAYFVVAEALTNVLKHARAERAAVTASVAAGVLRLQVRDDGVGGASPTGHGLTGIEDRVTALGGTLQVDSPPGRGTLLEALLPLPSWEPHAAAERPESSRSASESAAS